MESDQPLKIIIQPLRWNDSTEQSVLPFVWDRVFKAETILGTWYIAKRKNSNMWHLWKHKDQRSDEIFEHLEEAMELADILYMEDFKTLVVNDNISIEVGR